MCCPYFDPAQPRERLSGFTRDSMLPLGGFWTGICRADEGAPSIPDEAALRPLCNLGYARGNCARFPTNGGPDAVRFTVTRDDRESVLIDYVIERDHHPFAHGPLAWLRPSADFDGPQPAACLRAQARAYVASYLSRKAEADPR
jgi:hypothetical protein